MVRLKSNFLYSNTPYKYAQPVCCIKARFKLEVSVIHLRSSWGAGGKICFYWNRSQRSSHLIALRKYKRTMVLRRHHSTQWLKFRRPKIWSIGKEERTLDWWDGSAGKDGCHQVWWPEVKPWNPYHGSCSLSCAHMLWHVRAHTMNSWMEAKQWQRAASGASMVPSQIAYPDTSICPS